MADLNSLKTTKSIYNGVLLYSLCGIAKSIVDPIAAASSAAAMFSGSSSGGGAFSVISLLLALAIIAGYVLFFLGLSHFRTVVNTNDAPAVQKLYVATIISIVAYVCMCIPFMGLIGKILSLVAFIMMLLGFSALKKSATFPADGRNGASKLFIAMILSVVGVVLGWIPLIGGVLSAILGIVGFILTILGWKKVAYADYNNVAKIEE